MPPFPFSRWKYVASAAAVLAGAYACASAGPPPGGPPDAAPPQIVSITPKSMTEGAKIEDIEIKFDEVISEVPKGGQDLTGLVFISPRVRNTDVSWHRDRITIHPKGGWKPNTVYSVQVSSGIQDLRNNTIDSSITVVFSTGGPIPNTNITGVAFDWVAGRAAVKALIEAIAKDSTIYQVLSDSVGRFNLRHAPPGEYAVRAVIDRNANRVLDPTEGFDTVRVLLTERADVELYAFPHDTVGLRVSEVKAEPQDSLRVLKVTFDKPLAPDQELVPSQFTIKRGDSSVVGVTLVQSVTQRAVDDSLRQKAKADSTAAANLAKTDTSAAARARADTLARRRTADSIAAVERAAREARRLALVRGGRPVEQDTTKPPKMKRPTVSPDVYITLAEALRPGTPYRLFVTNVRSLSGTVKSPERGFVTPRAPEKKDSVPAPARRPP